MALDSSGSSSLRNWFPPPGSGGNEVRAGSVREPQVPPPCAVQGCPEALPYLLSLVLRVHRQPGNVQRPANRRVRGRSWRNILASTALCRSQKHTVSRVNANLAALFGWDSDHRRRDKDYLRRNGAVSFGSKEMSSVINPADSMHLMVEQPGKTRRVHDHPAAQARLKAEDDACGGLRRVRPAVSSQAGKPKVRVLVHKTSVFSA
jgi:hypothetical protein